MHVWQLLNETPDQESTSQPQFRNFFNADVDKTLSAPLQMKARVRPYLVRAAATCWPEPESINDVVPG